MEILSATNYTEMATLNQALKLLAVASKWIKWLTESALTVTEFSLAVITTTRRESLENINLTIDIRVI